LKFILDFKSLNVPVKTILFATAGGALIDEGVINFRLTGFPRIIFL
jgi:hypothetical protein